MKIPFGTIAVTQKSKDLIKELLNSNRVTNGKYVRQFEEKFAALIGVKEAVAVSSGTDAIIIALSALYDFGARRDDEVILPALSFVATGNAVLHAGFRPVFVDIDQKTLNINPLEIEGVITKKTKAIIAVHLMGKAADMDMINYIANRYNLFVIEDAAEAYGTIYKGKKAGILGDMATFSHYVAHMITTVEGGTVVTDNSDFAEILRSLRVYGRACKCKNCKLNISSGHCEKRFQYNGNKDRRFMFERIGFSSKMNELEAAIGIGSLYLYNRILKKRRKNLIYLKSKFKKFHPYLFTIEECLHEQIGPHAFPIVLGEKVRFNRNEFVYYLEKCGIETRNLFLSMPTQCPGFRYLGYRLGQFPNAEYLGNKGLHIGIHQDMQREHLDYIIDTIEDFLTRQN